MKRITGEKVAQILRDYQDYISLDDKGNPVLRYKKRMYRDAADKIATLGKIDLEEVAGMKGIGPSIYKKVKEIVETGTLKSLEKLKKKHGDFGDMTTVTGVGIVTAAKLKREHGAKSAKDIVKLVEDGTIKNKSIIVGLVDTKRRPRKEVEPIAEKVRKAFKSHKFEICGSYRRGKEDLKDLDAMTDATKAETTKILKKLGPIVEEGNSKISTIVNGLKVEVRLIEEDNFGALKLHLTGPWRYNQYLRRIALSKGLTLNEYGLHDEDKNLASGFSEREIIEFLGEKYLTPRKRETFNKNWREVKVE